VAQWEKNYGIVEQIERQAHSVRGFLAGVIRKKLELDPIGTVITSPFLIETGSKWLELHKQVAPRVERVAIIYTGVARF
jgi:hypothetical protein